VFVLLVQKRMSLLACVDAVDPFVSMQMTYSSVLGLIRAERPTAGAVILEMMGVALRW
jgi:hypothetical protein